MKSSRPGLLLVAWLAASCATAQEPQQGATLAGPPVQLESVAVLEAATIDGKADDALWTQARELELTALKVWPEPEARGTTVFIRSVHSATHIYFLLRWEDASRDDRAHKPWVWNAESEAYEVGAAREDMFSLAFEHTGVFDPDMLSGNVAVWDLWQWKATRTNPQGYAMDRSHHHSLDQPSGKARSFTARSGVTIWIARPEDAGEPVERKQPAPESFAGESVRQYLPGTPTGSQADVRAAGSWQDGWWTLELARRLDTGYSDDTSFDPGRSYLMALAPHDRTGGMDKATLAIELRFVASE